ncbi:MAG: hypothetical protein ACRDLB_13745 [Actinomycetota bacterium]
MIDPTNFALFCAAAVALLVVPGPSVTYIVARSVDQGGGAGLISVLGIFSDGMYALAATAIRSRLIRSRAFTGGSRIFTGVTYLGLGITAAVTGRAES